MSKDFDEFLELTKRDEFKSMQQSAIDLAVEHNGGIVETANVLQIATDISSLQSLNLIRLYHAWTHSNSESFAESD